MKLIKYAAAALLALSSLSASAALISIVDSGSVEYAPNIAALVVAAPKTQNSGFVQSALPQCHRVHATYHRKRTGKK